MKDDGERLNCVGDFYEQCVELSKGATVKDGDLANAYSRWAEANGQIQVDFPILLRHLNWLSLGSIKRARKPRWTVSGLRLRPLPEGP